jgi:hypothetical protein
MVLDDEYGEFGMLSIDIVKLAEDFDEWDELWADEGWVTPTNYDGPTVVDIWGSAFGSYQAEESENWGHKDHHSYRQLTKNELKKLREILQTQRNERHYKLVCRFIKWAIEYGPGELDFNYELYRQDLYEIYFLGDDTDLGHDRLMDISDRIGVHSRMFFDNYYESMLPLYVQSLREIIKTQQAPLPC